MGRRPKPHVYHPILRSQVLRTAATYSLFSQVEIKHATTRGFGSGAGGFGGRGMGNVDSIGWKLYGYVTWRRLWRRGWWMRYGWFWWSSYANGNWRYESTNSVV